MNISKTTKKTFFFSFLFVLLFCACYLKKSDEKKTEKRMSSFLYDIALKEYLNKLSNNETKAENLVFKNLENQFFTYIIQNGKNFFVIESLYKSCKAEVDSKNFYVGFDNADYVDSIVLQSEELKNDLDSLENNSENPFENADNFDTEKSKSIEKTLENSKLIEKLYINRLNELKFLEFEKELFIPDDEVIIEKNEKSVSKVFYDDLYRVIKKENWNIGSLLDSKILKTEIFEYYEDSLISKSKIEITETNKNAFMYDKNGNVENIKEYSIFENKDYLITETNLYYDDKDRIKQKIETKYTYDEEYKKKPTVNTKKFVYANKENEDLTADYEYFENDILKIKAVYSETKGNYTQEIFFDNMSVKSFYEDNLLKKDIYYIDGVEKRVVDYE